MASLSAADAKSATLAPATADDVTLTGFHAKVQITNRSGTDTIYGRFGATNPTVAGDDAFVIPPGMTYSERVQKSGAVVRLISSGAAPYSVVGAD